MNSKQKGKRGELEFAKLCRAEGYTDVRRSAQYCGNTGEAADIVGLPGVHVEVKRGKVIRLTDAVAQAVRDSEKSGRIPLVAHRRDNEGWLITMRAEDWFNLYREWEAGCMAREDYQRQTSF
ncbi:MAG: hypothetical protein MR209_00125 [Veillonellaceae bacterium]|nr:hypothetical protein [Veillonellaceae bacterium]